MSHSSIHKLLILATNRFDALCRYKYTMHISVIILVLAVIVVSFPMNQTEPLQLEKITHDGGNAYVVPMEPPSFWKRVFWRVDGKSRFNLRLYENGQQLGPANSPHENIRAYGNGSYSFWRRNLFFSSSDNMVPVASGRVFSVEYPLSPRIYVYSMGVIAAGILVFALVRTGRFRHNRILYFDYLTHAAVAILLCTSVIALVPMPYSAELSMEQVVRDEGNAYRIYLGQPLSWSRFFWTLSGSRDSDLRLYENGKSLGPANSLHDDIRMKGGGGYSHWGDTLFFSTPDGSDPRTTHNTFTIACSLSPAWYVYLLATLASVILTIKWVCSSRPQKNAETIETLRILRGSILRMPFAAASNLRRHLSLVYRGMCHPGTIGEFAHGLGSFFLVVFPCVTMTILALLWLGATVYFACRGYVLAPAVVISRFPCLEGIADFIFPQIYMWIVAYALISSLWLGFSGIFDRRIARQKTIVEVFTISWMRFWALPCICAIFLFELGLYWSGNNLSNEGQTAFGLMMFSDGQGYVFDVTNQIMTGKWSYFGSRRPMAAALRSLFFFMANNNIHRYLAIQAVGLAIALWLACRSVSRAKGAWAALVYFGSCCMFIRTFIASPMTESLGLIISLLSVPALLLGMQKRSIGWLLAAFITIMFSLSIRMGAIITIPALGIWVVIAFVHTWSGRIKVVSKLIIIGCFLLAATYCLHAAFGDRTSKVGGNLAYTIAGMSLRGDWHTSREKYWDDLCKIQSEEDIAAFLYQKAWQNIREKPSVFLSALLDRAEMFVEGIPNRLFGGFEGRSLIPSLSFFLLIAFIPGGVWWLTSRKMTGEVSLYLLFLLGLATSACIIIADAGWRVISASYPILWLISANFGISPLDKNKPRIINCYEARLSAILIILLFGGMFVAPYAAHRRGSQFDNLDYSGRRYYISDYSLGGFLVTPDDFPRSLDIPTIKESKFLKFLSEHHRFAAIAPIIRSQFRPQYSVSPILGPWLAYAGVCGYVIGYFHPIDGHVLGPFNIEPLLKNKQEQITIYKL